MVSFCLFRKVIFFLFPILFFLFHSGFALAQQKDFEIEVISNYNIDQEGLTTVQNSIKIRNKTKFNYTDKFEIKVLGLDDLRNVKAYDNFGSLPVSLKKDEDSSEIQVKFPGMISGLDQINQFNISYDSDKIAKKTENVWEVEIPSLENPDQFAKYDINIFAPPNFGNLSISKPFKKFGQGNQFSFSKEETGKSGVSLIFGKEMIYSFNLNYHISNSNLFPVKEEITIPSDTNYQEVMLKKINPKPVNVYEDSDGNWRAVYKLSPRQKTDVNVKGFIKLSAFPKKEELAQESKKNYLEERKFWESQNGNIKELAQKLKTPEKIYNFVVNKLKYDYGKIIDNNERLGAQKALVAPSSSSCLEFTDLFVAVSRAAGIPAREVEGYAYSQNSKLRSILKIKDILHVWPEYYDEDKKTWIMVDPTWSNTTGGSDYFNSLDLRHIAFVVRGIDSVYPLSAGYFKGNLNNKDITVAPLEGIYFKKNEKIEFSSDIASVFLPVFPVKFKINLKNKGNVSMQNRRINIDSDLSSGNNYVIDTGIIPPGGEKMYDVHLENVLTLTNRRYKIKIQFNNNIYTKDIKIGLPGKQIFYFTGGIIFAVFLLFIAGKTRRLHF